MPYEDAFLGRLQRVLEEVTQEAMHQASSRQEAEEFAAEVLWDVYHAQIRRNTGPLTGEDLRRYFYCAVVNRCIRARERARVREKHEKQAAGLHVRTLTEADDRPEGSPSDPIDFLKTLGRTNDPNVEMVKISLLGRLNYNELQISTRKPRTTLRSHVHRGARTLAHLYRGKGTPPSVSQLWMDMAKLDWPWGSYVDFVPMPSGPARFGIFSSFPMGKEHLTVGHDLVGEEREIIYLRMTQVVHGELECKAKLTGSLYGTQSRLRVSGQVRFCQVSGSHIATLRMRTQSGETIVTESRGIRLNNAEDIQSLCVADASQAKREAMRILSERGLRSWVEEAQKLE